MFYVVVQLEPATEKSKVKFTEFISDLFKFLKDAGYTVFVKDAKMKFYSTIKPFCVVPKT